MLFKGGTSLSKVYGAIERFSEDVDISLHRHDLGFSHARDPQNASGRKARGRLLDEADCGSLRSRVRHRVENPGYNTTKPAFADSSPLQVGDRGHSCSYHPGTAARLPALRNVPAA
jgi:hypothetical protein